MKTQSKKQEHCLEMLRRFAVHLDGEAGGWLIANDSLVKEVLVGHLDRLTPSERLDVYTTLFGFFRQHYKAVMNVRLQLEQEPKCRERLMTIEQLHRELIDQPYVPITEQDLLSHCENDLKHDSEGIRCVGAYGVWALTKNAKKVVPTLLEILRNRDGEARVEAARLLGEVSPLDEFAIQTLREIANDLGDPVRLVAEESLRQIQRSPKASDGGLGDEQA